MTIKTLIVGTVLACAPVLAAACPAHEHDKQAMTCAASTAYDADTNTCKVVSG